MIRSLKVARLLAITSIIRGNIGVILLTILILVLVALNLLFVPSLLGGLVWGANERLINTNSSDIVIESEGDSSFIKNADELMSQIEAIDGVEATTSRNSLGAEIEFQDRRTSSAIHGINPDQERRIFKIVESMVEGSYLEPNDRDQIVLGIQIAGADKPEIELYARSLRSVHAGDKVDVDFANGVQKRYTVKGIFYTEFIQTDVQGFVTAREMQSVTGVTRQRASTIYVKTLDTAVTRDVIDRINQLRSELRILTWEDYAGIVRSMTDSFNVIDAILNAVNILVAGITIFIITYIDVANRRRQIGIQRAIGITPASITLSYVMRALFYAIVAMGLGWAIFMYGVLPLEARYPFHFPFGDVYLRVGLTQMLRAAAILLGVSLIAALIPVRGVLRIKIIDAIWG